MGSTQKYVMEVPVAEYLTKIARALEGIDACDLWGSKVYISKIEVSYEGEVLNERLVCHPDFDCLVLASCDDGAGEADDAAR